MGNRLNPEQRRQDLAALASEDFDVVVIGGGVTGAGIALDAASRGLHTVVVEAQDWAAGTSSRTSGIISGGLRYLLQGNLSLVSDSMHERALLSTTLAPHLVKPLDFLWPLRTRFTERAQSTLGLGVTEAMGVVRARRPVPHQRHHGRRGTIARFPGVRADGLTGSVEFQDARVDDARLVIALVRTAMEYGARAVSRVEVTRISRGADGPTTGLTAVDLETGDKVQIRTRGIIAATGVWSQHTQSLAQTDPTLQVLASKGAHIIVPRAAIDSQRAIFVRNGTSVLTMVPFPNHWLIGSTDTEWHEALSDPVATRTDVDALLEQSNRVLARPLTRDDVQGSFAGLRPLVQSRKGLEERTYKMSRSHGVNRVSPGMVAISGGKMTTYRLMAMDAVDALLGRAETATRPSVTHRTPLLGAQGLPAMTNQAVRIGSIYGWPQQTMTHLLERYGTELPDLLEMVDDQPTLAAQLTSAPQYLRVEVVWACRVEGAQHLEDILVQRIRLAHESVDRGLGALDEVASIAAQELGWDAERVAREKSNYRDRMAAEAAAALETSDRAAAAVRRQAPSLLPTDLD